MPSADREVDVAALDRALHRLYHGDVSRCVTPKQAEGRPWPVTQCLWRVQLGGDKARQLLDLLADEGLTVVCRGA